MFIQYYNRVHVKRRGGGVNPTATRNSSFFTIAIRCSETQKIREKVFFWSSKTVEWGGSELYENFWALPNSHESVQIQLKVQKVKALKV